MAEFNDAEQKEIKKLARQVLSESGTNLENVPEEESFNEGDYVPFIKNDNTVAKIQGTSIGSGGGGGGGEVTVDEELSDRSTNPVQNKAIKSAIDKKQDTLVGSGTGQNVKTINGESIVGSGNIVIQGGGGTGTVSGVKVGSSGSVISPTNGVVTIPSYEDGAQKHIAPTASEVKTALGTGSGTTKYLREDGTWATPPSGGGDVTGVKGDSESQYRTGNVSITKENIGLGNVGNFKAVSTVANQGLSNIEKENARTNIGAGTSNFSGSYNDLTNKPTIPCADKSYTPLAHSGLGRKNLELKDGGSNVLTQSDFDQTNTIYVVGYDFDLDGANIQMPEGCVLDFEGGNVTNGTLVSNDTEIIGQLPENTNTLYGQYYKDKKPLNYNLRVVQHVSTAVEFAFIAPADYVSFDFYPQGLCIFKYNQKKYHLMGGYKNISGTDAGFMLLFNENYKFIGSTRTTFTDHGNGFTVKGDKLYKAGGSGVNVYNISDIVAICTANDEAPHGVDYNTRIQPIETYTIDHAVQDIDYDAKNDEFVTIDGSSHCVIYDGNFNQKKYLTLNVDAFIEEKIGTRCVFQGCVLKNGIVYGNVWVSDWSKNPTIIDSGANIFYTYDVVKDKIVSFEELPTPYQDGECEGLVRDPDDDNTMYFTIGYSLTDTSNSICAFCKVSQTDSMYSVSVKRRSEVGFLNDFGVPSFRVNCSYNYENGASNGSMLRPYTTISSALAMMIMQGGECDINIISDSNEYILPKIVLRNKVLRIIGLDGAIPTLNGSISSYGGKIRLEKIKLKATETVNIDMNGYLYMANAEVIGTGSGSGITLRGHSSAAFNSVTINNFNKGIDAINALIYFAGSITNCSTGIYDFKTPINLTATSFANVTECFYIDDSPISTFLGAISVSNATRVIAKDGGYRGNVNLMFSVTSSASLDTIFDFMNKGIFYETTIGFRVVSENITYNGIPVEKGEYSYAYPGFMLQGYPHVMVSETENSTTHVKTFRFLNTFGTFEQRPPLNAIHRGFIYYDETLGVPAYWNGGGWIEMESEPDSTQGYWKKLGEITPTTTTFGDSTVSFYNTTATSTSRQWTNIQNNTVYRTFITISPIPYSQNDLLKFVFKGIDKNTEVSINYDGVSGAISLISGVYNKYSFYLRTPSIGNRDRTNIIITSDIKYFNGTIEIYKKIE